MTSRICRTRTIFNFNPVLIILIVCTCFIVACSEKDAEIVDDRPAEFSSASVSKARSSLVSSQREYMDQVGQFDLDIERISAEISRIRTRIGDTNKGGPLGADITTRLYQTELMLQQFEQQLLRIPGAEKVMGAVMALPAVSFVCTVVIGLVWFRFKRKTFFEKRKKLMLSCSLILLLMYFSPAIVAQELNTESRESTSIVDGQKGIESLNQQLSDVIAVLESNELQRAILLLEARARRGDVGWVQLPQFTVKSALLKPLESFDGLGVQYLYTLAALYEEEDLREKTLESLEKLLSVKYRAYSSDDADLVLRDISDDADLVLRAIKFLINNNETALVKDKIGLVIRRINDPNVLAALAEKLLNTKFSADAQRAFARAIKHTRDPDQLIAIASTLFDKGLTEEGGFALERALQFDCDTNQIAGILALSTGNQLAGVTSQAVDKAVLVISPEDDAFKANFDRIYGLLLQYSEVGAAVQLFQGTIDRVVQYRDIRGLRLLEIAAIAVSHQHPDQARLAVQKLNAILGQKSLHYTAPLLGVAEKEQELPNRKEAVSLRTLSATLSEANSRNEEADKAYLEASIARMQQIIKSYGRNGGQWLNDLLLARETLERRGNEQTREQLDKLYTLLMVEKASAFGAEREEKLAELSKLREEKLIELESAQSELAELQQRSAPKLQLVLYIFNSLARFLLTLIVLVVVVFLAWSYCKRFNSFRLTAFIGKLVESFGWAAAISVTGLIPGLVIAWAGQAILLLHRAAFQSEKFVTEEEVISGREGAQL